MRPSVFIIGILLSQFCFSQTEPVNVDIITSKINDYQYSLQFNFSIEKGWHIYAVDDAELSVNGILITSDNDAVNISSGNQPHVLGTKIHDPIFERKELSVFQKDFQISRVVSSNNFPPAFKIVITGFASNNKEFLPFTITKNIQLYAAQSTAQNFRISSIDIKSPASDCGDANTAASKGLLAIFLLGFGGGLLALLTPCVFPMIPVTVSYFTGKAKTRQTAIRNGIGYGSSILLIYLFASLPFHLIGNLNPQVFNSIATNAWINIFFFIVFILFALSFFGLFEITLPSSLSNLAGSKTSLGSAAGIFFMALTLAVVSFSCTGPILGSLLVGSLNSVNGAWALTAGMLGFGLALGLPFALFAMFPQWMQRLPKSGSWMNVVKKSLAFIELALAIKFLSNADLVEHWGILKREVFISLWFLIFLSLSFYLFGVFEKRKQFHPSPVLRVATNNSKPKHVSSTRYLFGTLTLLFSLYLTPGLTQSTYANLKLLSGFAPPLSYSIYGKSNVRGKGLEANVVNDYEKAVQLAKQQHKPILIDFTGWACVNCRKMEENVWTNSEIKNLIKEKFILVSLYVDDRKNLPAGERVIWKNGEGQEKEIVTIGDKYATFQVENFKQATQPLYAILNPDKKLMNHPVGYTPSVSQYKQWLECGYNAFENTGKK